MLVYQAASSLGRAGSSPMRHLVPWPLLAVFPLLILAGQLQVDHPQRLPWLFPVVNLGIVSIPSFVIAMTVARNYARTNRWAWPVSWREWTTGIIYGAIGATTVASIINLLYLVIMGIFLIDRFGSGSAIDLGDNLSTLPRAWGIFFDVTVLSVVAPLNEEFWKGMLVAFFFFRKGRAARCFLWGVLAGCGFNLIETFENSISVVSPAALADQTLGGRWWLFAVARAGTGTIHAFATGLSALGFYGLFRRRARYLVGYPLGVLTHGTWNFLAYANAGDAFFSGAGPDSRALDYLSAAAMVALVAGAALLLWELPRRLRDDRPAPIYQLLGMLPRG
jgi:hypothetical protein